MKDLRQILYTSFWTFTFARKCDLCPGRDSLGYGTCKTFISETFIDITFYWDNKNPQKISFSLNIFLSEKIGNMQTTVAFFPLNK